MSLANTYDYATLMHMGLPSVTPAESKTIGRSYNADTFKVGSTMEHVGMKRIVKYNVQGVMFSAHSGWFVFLGFGSRSGWSILPLHVTLKP